MFRDLKISYYFFLGALKRCSSLPQQKKSLSLSVYSYFDDREGDVHCLVPIQKKRMVVGDSPFGREHVQKV